MESSTEPCAVWWLMLHFKSNKAWSPVSLGVFMSCSSCFSTSWRLSARRLHVMWCYVMWCGEVVVVLRWLLDRGESHQSLDNLIETSSSEQPGATDVTPIPHFDEKTWFIRCNRAEAEKLLRNTADGTFLIRPSTIAPYALSIVWVAVAVCIHSV